MAIFKREITQNIRKRLLEKRRFIQVIIGPRQVGKTTAIQQVLQGISIAHHYAAADLPAPPDTKWIERQWEIARQNLKTHKKAILVLDEIQKISHWSIEVKRLWDEDTKEGNNVCVVLLGSSSLLIQKGLDESLAGRFELIRFPHWTWMECRDCFGWSPEQYVYFGGYPGGAPLVKNETRWAQYIKDSLIETAISKDILMLNRVEKPALLRQLFVLACEYGGQILSYQKILGQLTDAGNTVTLAHYQRLLESAFLIRGLPKWSGNKIRQRNSTPKWIPLNTGLMTSLANRSYKELLHDSQEWGRLFEVTVGAHLINQSEGLGVDVFYWREGNHEIDYILKKGKCLLAIEVKSGKKPTARLGFEKFTQRNKHCKTIVVGGGEISLQDFLETLLLNLF